MNAPARPENMFKAGIFRYKALKNEVHSDDSSMVALYGLLPLDDNYRHRYCPRGDVDAEVGDGNNTPNN